MAIVTDSGASTRGPHASLGVFPVAALVLVVITLAMRGQESWVVSYPSAWSLNLATPADQTLKFIAKELSIASIKVSDITRFISAMTGAPIEYLVALLTEGFNVEVSGAEYKIPPVPWIVIATTLVLLSWRVGGGAKAALTAATVAYVFLLGLWTSTVTTLVSVFIAVAISVALGLALGIWASGSSRVSKGLEPVYDALQTIPIFSYLSIILIFFGFGPVAALIATVVFAVAPMARTTELALSQTPASLEDLAFIAGCTPAQRLMLVALPAARRELLLGLNQVTMLSLSMVIIASVIGAGGLGSDVLRGLKSLRMTTALQAGFAISLIAICLDRTLRAWAERSSSSKAASGAGAILSCRHGLVLLGLACMAAYLFEGMRSPPTEAPYSFGTVLDRWLTEFNAGGRGGLAVAQDVFVRWILVPYRNFFASLPWLPVVLLAGLVGTRVSGIRTGILCSVLLTALAVLGMWPRAILSLYLVSLSLIIALAIGFPLGVLTGLSRRGYAIMEVIADVIQTLPAFVYLIPVVVLFGAGDFPALIAIVIYVIAPVVKYVASGVQQIAQSGLSDAADMAGCTTFQKVALVLLPVAAPQIILGINQAVMLGFSMLVITSLVGSRGLEEETLIAISQVRPGKGLIAGIGIAALAICVDRLMRGISEVISQRAKG